MKVPSEKRVPQRFTYVIDSEYSNVIESEVRSVLQMMCIRHVDILHDSEGLTALFLATDGETETVKKHINDTYDFIGD